jgi:hypothetical protein
MIPGIIEVRLNPAADFLVRAGGALAVFAVVFFAKPARIG